MILALTLLSGLAWTVVYVVAIRIGFQQRTYAIPAAALALNIAWESIYATHGVVTGNLSVQTFVNVAWALADVVIVYTFLRYGRRELPDFVSRPMFVAWTVLIFAAAYTVQWLFIAEFGWAEASRYAAFLQNLLMSGLFHRNVRGSARAAWSEHRRRRREVDWHPGSDHRVRRASGIGLHSRLRRSVQCL
jgi:hypothetical protein